LTALFLLCYHEEKREGIQAMKTILIVIESEDFGRRICDDLKNDFITLLCDNAYTAEQLMRSRPDGMILEMNLPGKDGMIFLEDLDWLPPVILTLSKGYSDYDTQKLIDFGVGYQIRMPCALRAVTNRIRDMMKDRDSNQDGDQKNAAHHLTLLGIASADGGGKQLRVAIPLLAQDSEQKISAELYPAVAKICGSTVKGVEKAMGRTIKKAWDNRDPDLWEEYFPRRTRHPSNRVFLKTLAQKIG